MASISTLLSHDIVSALVYTLMHTFWQAPLIALIMYIALRTTDSSTRKHNTAMASLLLLLMSSIFTLCFYILSSISWYDTPTAVTMISDQHPITSIEAQSATTLITDFNLMTWIDQHLNQIALSWLIGILIFTLRVGSGLVHLGFIRRSVSYDVPCTIEISLYELQKKMGLDRLVRIGVSTLIKTPMMMGHLKPIIVLPIAAINHLSVEETESIIAHELAHIYRHDYVQNILVLMVESLFFFNPAVWWMCSVIRSERENASDDIVLKMGIDNMLYARTLVRLQELQTPLSSRLALQFNGTQPNSLMARIKRIMKQPMPPQYFVWERGVAMGLLLVSLLTIGTASTSLSKTSLTSEHKMELMSMLPSLITKDSTTLLAVGHKDAPAIDIRVSEGTIKEMSVGHEEISPDRFDTINVSEVAGIVSTREAIAEGDKVIKSIIIQKQQDGYSIHIDTLIEDSEKTSTTSQENNLKIGDSELTLNIEELRKNMKTAMSELKEKLKSIDCEHEDYLREELSKELTDINAELNENLLDINKNIKSLSEELQNDQSELNRDIQDISLVLGEELATISRELTQELSEASIGLVERITDSYVKPNRRSKSKRKARHELQLDLIEQIQKDALWQTDQNTIVIDSTQLIVNDVKQSKSLYQKYYRIIERHLPQINGSNYMRVSLRVKGRSLEDAEDVSLHISIE